MNTKTKLVMALLLISVFLVSLCVDNTGTNGNKPAATTPPEIIATTPNQENTATTLPANNPLSDLQKGACTDANDGGTCDTKLADFDLVSLEDCCKYMGKCCSK